MTRVDDIIIPIVSVAETGKPSFRLMPYHQFAELPSPPLRKELMTPLEVSDWSPATKRKAGELMGERFGRFLDDFGIEPDETDPTCLGPTGALLVKIAFSGLIQGFTVRVRAKRKRGRPSKLDQDSVVAVDIVDAIWRAKPGRTIKQAIKEAIKNHPECSFLKGPSSEASEARYYHARSRRKRALKK
jgi:hypothetical protein